MSHALMTIEAATDVMGFTQPETTVDVLPFLGRDVEGASAPVTMGAIDTPSVPTAPNGSVVAAGHFLYDYYYRIWVIPQTLRAQNPVFGVPIPFAIWNAYPQPLTNTLTDIVAVDDDGLELDFAVSDEWRAIEYKVVNVTILPTAPANVDASYTFTFTFGEADFRFLASIADFVQMVPDPPIVETLEWLTDVIQSHNGGEQRIALRGQPRRAVQYTIPLENDEERAIQYRRWHKSLKTRIILPYYQYSTNITQASSIGDSYIYFDPARTDMRDAEYTIVYDTHANQGYLVKLDTVDATGATTDNPLAFAPQPHMVIAPAFVSRLSNRGGFSMNSIVGKMSIDADVLVPRAALSRPGSTAVIDTYDLLPVLDRRPLAEDEVPERFDVNYSVLDGDTGLQEVKANWTHPFVSGTRQFLIQRLFEPEELDWWRDFLTLAHGRQNPILVPTWRADLELAEAPAPGASTMLLASSTYAGSYFPYETYQRLQIMTGNGIIYRRVTGAVDNGDDTTTITLVTPLGSDPADVDISMISYLNLSRLDSDKVTLTHNTTHTILELDVRTIDA